MASARGAPRRQISSVMMGMMRWAGDGGRGGAAAGIGEMEMGGPGRGRIDKDAELERLGKNIVKLKQEVARIEKKLSNPGFVSKAPEAVVQKERDKMEEAISALKQLEEQSNRISAL